MFAQHRSRVDPNGFWIYEVREGEHPVSAHEASGPFLKYRERLRPLVDGASVVCGNTKPFAVKGYEA